MAAIIPPIRRIKPIIRNELLLVPGITLFFEIITTPIIINITGMTRKLMNIIFKC